MVIANQHRVGILGNRLYPFNEAYANQARVVSTEYGLRGFTTSSDINGLVEKRSNYIIINSKYVGCENKILSLMNGGIIYTLLKYFEANHDKILLFGGIESEYLDHMMLSKCVPIISTIDDESKLQKFCVEIAPKLPRIIVQSTGVREVLVSKGVDPDKIDFIYPIVDYSSYDYTSPPPAEKEFRFLFASAPNTRNPDEEIFTAKGVPLLLEAFKSHRSTYSSKLTILWRGYYRKKLDELLSTLSLTDCVEVIDEVVSVDEYIKNSHATIIPYASGLRSPEYPLSALESLHCGRPVISTSVVELRKLINSYHCGCTVSPSVSELASGLDSICNQYRSYQDNCKNAATVVGSENLASVLADQPDI